MNFRNGQESPKEQKYYSPVGFDPNKYPGPIADHPNAALGLLHTLYQRRVIGNFEEDGWQALKAKYLESVMQDFVKPVRDHLVENHLIEVDERYIIGKKSKRYRIGPVLSGATWERRHVKDRRIAKKLSNLNEPDRDTWLPVHYFLEDCLRSVTLDSADTERILQEIGRTQIREHRIEAINEKNYFLANDQFGRVHTNICSLKRELRGVVRLKGEYCAELDIKIVNLSFLLTNSGIMNSDTLIIRNYKQFSYKTANII